MNKYLIIFLLLSPCFVYGSVIINEIAWMGTEASYNDEWIELYNNSDNNISLDGWILKADDGSPEINLSGIIPAKGFFLLERTDDDSNLNKIANLIYTGSLSNSGENLRLYNNSGEIIDEILNQDGWVGGDNTTKETMKRTNSEQQANVEVGFSDPEITEDGKTTPLRPETKSPIIHPKNIVINEVLPSPEGPDSENEWIELYNQNDFEVDLNNWIIKDTIGGVKEYILKDKIPALGYLVLKRPQTNITLNNDNDGLILMTPNKKVIDSVNFDKALQDQSYSRSSSKWFWTTTQTPNSKNIITQDTKPVKKTLVKNKETKLTKNEPLNNTQGAQILRNKLVDNLKDPPRIFVFLIGFIVALFCSIAFLIIKSNIRGFWY